MRMPAETERPRHTEPRTLLVTLFTSLLVNPFVHPARMYIRALQLTCPASQQLLCIAVLEVRLTVLDPCASKRRRESDMEPPCIQ